MKLSRSGFTIIELIVVIVVLGILAAIVTVSYSSAQATARDSRRTNDIGVLTKALEQYYADNGHYPDPASSGSVINDNWYSSGDNSWNLFKADLSNITTNVPSDPKNTSTSPLSTGGYSYAYYTGSYCGKTSGQWYLIVYRFEATTKTQFTDGTCTTNPLGETYYTGGASFYRSVH